MKKKVAMLSLMCVMGGVSAQDALPPELSEGVVRMSAHMNALAQACKHMTAAELDEAKNKQKQAAITDMQLAEAQYKAIYAAAETEFQSKWSGMSGAEQKNICDQMLAQQPVAR